MKRFVLFIICLSLISSLFCMPAAAEMNGQILVSETIEQLGNGDYYVERIYMPAAQPYSNTRTGTKTAQYISGNTLIYSISVTGTFEYDGSTAKATKSSYAINTYVEGATITDGYSYVAGASAIAWGSVSYSGATLQKTVTLTCSKTGTLT